MIRYQETTYGFDWGAASITRVLSDQKLGWVTFCIDTPKHHGNKALQVYVTKTGKVRIHGATGEWTPPRMRGS
jgi:hypothetical protein